MEVVYILLGLAGVILWIAVLVAFFQIARDIKAIREVIAPKFEPIKRNEEALKVVDKILDERQDEGPPKWYEK